MTVQPTTLVTAQNALGAREASAPLAGAGNGVAGGDFVGARGAVGELVSSLHRHGSWFYTIVCTCVAAGAVYGLFARPVYLSKVELYIDQSAVRGLGDWEHRIGNTWLYLNTQTKVVTSEQVLAGATKLLGMDQSMGQASAVGYVRQFLDVRANKESDILSISFKSPVREEAAAVVNAVADAYLKHETAQRVNAATEALGVLESEFAVRRADLEAKLARAPESSKAEGERAPAPGADQIWAQLVKSTEELVESEVERATLQRQSYATTQDGQKRLELLRERGQDLEKAYERQRQLLMERGGEQGVDQLDLAAKQAAKACEILAAKMLEVRLARASARPVLRAIEPARPPQFPVGPRRLRIVAMSLALGVLVGGAVVLIRDIRG